MNIDQLSEKLELKKSSWGYDPEETPYDWLQLIQIDLHEKRIAVAFKRLLLLSKFFGWRYGGPVKTNPNANLENCWQRASHTISQLGRLVAGEDEPVLYRAAVEAVLLAAQSEGIDLEAALDES